MNNLLCAFFLTLTLNLQATTAEESSVASTQAYNLAMDRLFKLGTKYHLAFTIETLFPNDCPIEKFNFATLNTCKNEDELITSMQKQTVLLVIEKSLASSHIYNIRDKMLNSFPEYALNNLVDHFQYSGGLLSLVRKLSSKMKDVYVITGSDTINNRPEPPEIQTSIDCSGKTLREVLDLAIPKESLQPSLWAADFIPSGKSLGVFTGPATIITLNSTLVRVHQSPEK